MSGTVIDEPTTSGEHASTEALSGQGPEGRPSKPEADLTVLEDFSPEWMRTTRGFAGQVLVVGILFLFFCFRPLWHTDLWGHLAYGRTIWQQGSLPTHEPLLPLAQGMTFVDTAWLSQLIGYLTQRQWNHAGLQGLYAGTICACAALLAARAFRDSRNGWFGLLSVTVFLAVAWNPLTVIRPQLAGMVCFTLLLYRMTSHRRSRWDWVGVPVLFVLWANLHGSFPMGLGLLACFAVGRALDLYRKTCSLTAVWQDDRFRRTLLLTELAAAATLVNPYGIGLHWEALRLSSNPNLQDLTEWSELSFREWQGMIFAGVCLMLAWLYRVSPRRVRLWEILALVGFGGATLWSNRMIVWFAPVAAVLVARHASAATRKALHGPLIPVSGPKAGKWTVVAIGLVFISFGFSPLGVKVLHKRDGNLKRAVCDQTPLAAVEYLNANPPQGQVFNIYEWGDYLQWAGPTGMKVFVNSHAHQMPQELWRAYMMIINLQPGWEEAIDRLGVNTMILDTQYRELLIKRLRSTDKPEAERKWKLGLEKDGQVILLRKKPI